MKAAKFSIFDNAGYMLAISALGYAGSEFLELIRPLVAGAVMPGSLLSMSLVAIASAHAAIFGWNVAMSKSGNSSGFERYLSLSVWAICALLIGLSNPIGYKGDIAALAVLSSFLLIGICALVGGGLALLVAASVSFARSLAR